MSAWLESEGFPGAARWMSLQAREELFHAQKLYQDLLDRGAPVKLGAIEAPPCKWKSPLDLFEGAYAHEQKVTGLINGLMGLAKAEADHAAEIFLQWFVSEQVEEEKSALEITQKLKLAGAGAGIFMIDQNLAARVLSQSVKDALTGA
jgi:ferritin